MTAVNAVKEKPMHLVFIPGLECLDFPLVAWGTLTAAQKSFLP